MKHTVPFASPGANYLSRKPEIEAAIARVLSSGYYILGEEVADFEKEFASYCGADYAVGVGSGTEAIHLALRAGGIGRGDLVATVSNTAVATVAAIELAGATPLLLDVDDQTYTLDVDCLASAIDQFGSRLKAVIPVHLYGHPARMDAIMDIAKRAGLFVVEDCAQSHGATWKGKMTGTWGHCGAFSFYPTKNLGAIGDGGAVVCKDEKLAHRMRLLRQYGWEKRYVSEIPGMNTRLDEIQAAILRVKLPYLDADNGHRREIAATYTKRLADIPGLILPTAAADCRHVYHQFTIRSETRNSLLDLLRGNGIGAAILYPIPIHQQPAYRNRLLVAPGGLPRTEHHAREILCLPIHPELGSKQVDQVVTVFLR